MRNRSFVRDDRAVSKQIGYVLSITVITLLMTGLIVSTASLVEDNTDRSTEAELEVVADRLAAQVMAADRLVEKDDGTAEAYMDANVPNHAGDGQYAVSVDGESDGIRVESTSRDISTTVPIQVENEVVVDRVVSNDLVIVVESDTIEITPEDRA